MEKIDGGRRKREARLTCVEAAREPRWRQSKKLLAKNSIGRWGWGRCRVVDPEVVGAPASGDAPRKRTGLETWTDAISKGRGRKVIRAKDAAAATDTATEDPIPRACR